MPRADDRTPQKRQADDAVAASTEITVTPELWIKGVQVDAAAFGYPPITLTRRTFATRADELAALAAFAEMCIAGFHPHKAYRMCLAVQDPVVDAQMAELLKRLTVG